MKYIIQLLVLLLTVTLFNACGGTANSVTPRGQAIDKIVAYAENNGRGDIPTLQDYIDAEISGVTEENLADINEIVGNLTRDEVDTPEEIQAIVNEINVNIAPIARLFISSVDVFTSEVITFTSKSTDVDGTIASTLWSVDGRPGTTETVFYHAFGQAGKYKVGLLVTDDDGASNSLVATITVSKKPVTPSTPVSTAFTGGTFNGKTYQLITSPTTNKVWLDRNLGASQVCTVANDALCYGDYYQWGRKADGHQSTNTTENNQALDVRDVGHSKFITSPVGAWAADSVDDDGSIRRGIWASTAGSNICPMGFRVPTYAELRTELLNTVINSESAFLSILKLPSSGIRSFAGGFINVGTYGGLWIGSGNNGGGSYLEYRTSSVIWGEGGNSGANTGTGIPVRCIKN
jgi:hypothetical protein